MHVAKFAKNYPDMELYFEGNRILFLNKGDHHGHPMWREYLTWSNMPKTLEELEELFDDWEFEDMKEPDYSYPAFNPEKLKKCKISFEPNKLKCAYPTPSAVTMSYENKKGVKYQQFIEKFSMWQIRDYFGRCTSLYDFD